MAEPMQVKVGVALDPASKQKIQAEINNLKSEPIEIKVTSDISAAQKTIDKFISTYRNKDIKLSIDANIKGGTSGSSSIIKTMQSIKTQAESIFKGINFNKVIDSAAGSIGQERKRIQDEFRQLGKMDVKISAPTISRDASGNVQSFALKIKEANKEVQTLSYSLKQVDGKNMFVLDGSNITALKNAGTQIDQLEKKIRSLSDAWDFANKQGKISDNGSFQNVVSDIEKLKEQLQSLREAAYVTSADLEKISDGIYSSKKTQQNILFDSAQLQREEKSLESYLKKIKQIQQSLESWQTRNPKMKSSGEISSIFSDLEKLSKLDTPDFDELDNVTNRITKVKDAAQQAGKTGATAFQNFKTKAQELGTYLASSMMFSYAAEGVKAMVNNVIELDTALTELKKTTEGSQQDYANFMSTAASTAQEVGAKISDVVQSAAEWSRSGYNLQQSGELARAATIYTNVSEYENVSDATTSLIASMKAYGIEAENVMSIVDKLNAVGNKTSTTSAGLGDSLLRSASALATAGNSIDESLGLIVAANNSVQNPEKVGNGLKTISLRSNLYSLHMRKLVCFA